MTTSETPENSMMTGRNRLVLISRIITAKRSKTNVGNTIQHKINRLVAGPTRQMRLSLMTLSAERMSTGGPRMDINPQTLTLSEAADLLKVHWQTLRQKAKSGEVPAARIGRRWVFLQSDLVTYLRSHYSTGRPRSQVQQNEGDSLCCTNDPIRASGGVPSRRLTEREYNNLLGQ